MDICWNTLHYVTVLILILLAVKDVAGSAEIVTATRGDTARLRCMVGVSGSPNVRWYDPNNEALTENEQVLSNDDRIGIEHPYDDEWILIIEKSRENDAGEYMCKIYVTPAIEKLFHLDIEYHPTIIGHTGDASVLLGTNVAFECNATGNPEPKVSWTLTSHTGEIKDLEHVGSKLLVENVNGADAGYYECEADNGVKPTAKQQMTLEVKFTPTVTLEYDKISQEVGKHTWLDCRISGNPLDDFYWEKDNQRLEDGDKYQIFSQDLGQYTKTLAALFILGEDDYGDYQCVATNSYGSDTTVITVYEPFTGSSRVTHYPEDIVIAPQHNVLINCTVQGMTPQETLTWWWNSPMSGLKRIFISDPSSQDNEDLVNSQPGKFAIVGHYNLQIKDVDFEDHGEYLCDISSKKNYSAAFTVVDKIVCENNGTLLESGMEALLLCSLNYSGPALNWEVEWRHEERRMSSINQDKEDQVSRLVSFPMSQRDEGRYECHMSSRTPIFSTACSMDIKMIGSDPTSAPSCGNPPNFNNDVLATILGVTVVAVAVMFLVILVVVVRHYRKEIEVYRPGKVRYRNGRLSMETEGLTTSANGNREEPPEVEV